MIYKEEKWDMKVQRQQENKFSYLFPIYFLGK